MNVSSFNPQDPLRPSDLPPTPIGLQAEDVVRNILDFARSHPQPGEGRAPTLTELLETTTLTEQAVPQFKAAINAQRVALSGTTLYDPETAEVILGQLTKLESLIPLFLENQAKTQAIDKAFERARTSSGELHPPFLSVSQWSAIAEPLAQWLRWNYINRNEPHLHAGFYNTLYDYHVQGLMGLVEDHFELAKGEWYYLRHHLSTPTTKEEAFQLVCLEATTKQALQELTEITGRLQGFVVLFEGFRNITPEQERGLSRLQSIQQELIDKKSAYARLIERIAQRKNQLPEELLSQTEEQYRILSPEAREEKRLALIAARPPVQRGWLGSIWHNITHPEEWSETTRAFLGVGLRALQISQHVIEVSAKTERYGTVTQWEAAGNVFEEAEARLPLVVYEGIVSAAKQELEALLEGRTPQGWEPPLSEAARYDQIYEYGRGLLVQRFNEALADNADALLLPSPDKVAAVTTPFFQVQEAMGDLSRGLGLQKSDQCFDLRETSRRLIQAFTEEREAIQVAVTATDANLEDYGTKLRNVAHQARLVEILDLPGIKVPIPQGISSTQTHAFLQATCPQIFQHWEALEALYTQSANKNQFLNDPEAKRLLAEIDESLERAFKDPSSFEQLHLDSGVKVWLAELRMQGGSLMIRSTGAEDTRESANAGGNLSVPYVAPSESAFTSAVGDVVRSYFGERSLQNRLNAGHNPFAEPLKLAVMAQEVIGETIGGASSPSEIPRSLVLFTNEPLYIGGEAFRAMRFSASYGHGEGVVGEQGIGTDTVTILFSLSHPDQLYVLYNNHEKPERLAPVRGDDGTVSLQKVANPPELQRRRVYNEEEVKHLARWALIGEGFFGGEPTDMELVTKEVNGQFVIYPVQARPVNRPPPEAPSYLDRTKLSDAGAAQIRAVTIVPGSSVITLTKQEELLIAPSLEEAERQFQKGVHKAVLVGRDEPANSHPVVNFSNLGIPCFYFRGDTAPFLNELLKEGKQAVVCAQTATFQVVEQSESVISKGFIVHPARLGASLSLTEQLPQIKTAKTPIEEARNQLFRVNTAKNNNEALTHLATLKESAFLQEFQKQTQELRERCESTPLIPEEVRITLLALQEIEEKVDASFEELRLAYTTREGRLEPLLHVKVLEELLFQPKESSGLGRHSIENLFHTLEGAKELLDYQQKVGELQARFLPLLLEGARQPDTSLYTEWKSFLLEMEKLSLSTAPYTHQEPISLKKMTGTSQSFQEEQQLLQQELRHFENMVRTFQSTQTLPTWLLFFFRGSEELSPRERLQDLNQLSSKQELGGFAPLLEDQKRYTTLQNRLPSLTSRASFEAFATSLKQEAETLHTASLGWDPNAGPMKKILLLNKMNQFVQFYDSAIKEMKRSSLEVEVKVHLFKEMLTPYYELMASWTPLLALDSTGQITIPNYLEKIKNILDNSNEEVHQLDPSRDFSVSAAKLGSPALFERHNPITLEDLFTLCHQNLLVVTSSLLNPTLPLISLQNGEMDALAVAADRLDQLKGTVDEFTYTPNRVGVTLDESTVTLHYNIPLRNHAAGINLIYNKEKGVLFEASFYGLTGARWGGRWDRWDALLNDIQLLATLDLLKLSEPPRTSEQGIHFSCLWKAESSLPLDLFHHGIDISFRRSDNAFIRNEFIEKKIAECTAAQQLELFEKFNQFRLINFFPLFIKNGLPTERVLTVLGDVFKGLGNQNTRGDAIGTLRTLITEGLVGNIALPLLKEMFKSSNPRISSSSIEMLGILIEKGFPINEALPLLKEALQSSIWEVRQRTFQTLRSLTPGNQALPLLKEAFKSSDFEIRISAIEALQILVKNGLSVDEALFLLEEALQDPHWSVRKIALETLETFLPSAKALQLLREALESSNWEVCDIAIEALVSHNFLVDEALSLLKEALQSSDWKGHRASYTLKTLVEKGLSPGRALPLLKEALKNAIFITQEYAIDALVILVEKNDLPVDEVLPLLEGALANPTIFSSHVLPLLEILYAKGKIGRLDYYRLKYFS